MEKIIVVIEKSSDHYGAYSENCSSIFAGGDNVAEVKENVLEAIRLIKSEWKKEDIPELLRGEYEIEYKFDVPSFLQYYSKIISLAGIERISGVNQTLLSHYISGFRKPSPKTAEKIETALHNLGKELSQVELV